MFHSIFVQLQNLVAFDAHRHALSYMHCFLYDSRSPTYFDFTELCIPPTISQYDVFQRKYSFARSLSKSRSNTSSPLCLGGQRAMYITKYPAMSTQQEDESAYNAVFQKKKMQLPTNASKEDYLDDCLEPLSPRVDVLDGSSDNATSMTTFAYGIISYCTGALRPASYGVWGGGS